MEIKNLPMNKPIKYIDEQHTSVLLTRVEEDKMIAQYVNKSNGDEVATMNLWANGDSELVGFDQSYWAFTISGSPATGQDVSDLISRKLKSVNISVKDRIIEVAI